MKSLLLASLATAAGLLAHAADNAAYQGLGANSVSAQTLEKFRAKPLDPDLARKVQAVLDQRAPGGGLLSADGKSLYFSWKVTGVTQVWRIDGPQRFPVQMTGGADATTIGDATPDGKWLVLSRDRNGEENPGLYLQPVKGGELLPIQHIAGVQTEFAFVSDDSRYVYYRSNDESRDSYAIYRYNIATGKKERLFNEKGHWEILDHQRDGHLLLSNSLSNFANEVWEWDPATGKARLILGQGEKEEYRARYGAHPGELLIVSNKFGEFRRLYKYVGGAFSPVTPELKWDVSNAHIDHAHHALYYTVNENGYSKSYALDAQTYAPLTLPEFKGAGHVDIGATSHDGQQVVLSVDNNTAPRSSYVFDWKTHQLTQWVLPASPESDPAHFATATLESYPARDGTRIPMFVRRPAKCEPGPCPVVVYFHGGPESQSLAGFWATAQLYVDAGFIVVDPNVRGSDGYGKAWLHMDDGPKRLDVITDIEDAAIYIRKNWGKDGKAPKIGVMGGSYGGYATLMAMTRFGGAYDAGVATVGMSNLVTFLQNTAPYRRVNRMAEYGDLEKDHDALVKLSPVTYIDRLQSPLLIIQGASDPRVPVGEAVQMYNAASAKGVPADLIIFADEGHGAQKRDNVAMSLGHTLAFFEKYLK